MMPSKIQWTEETWNPLAGCSIVSPGCRVCYAMGEALRLAGNPNPKIAAKYAGTVKTVKGKPVWTGKVNIADDATLSAPLRWKTPRMIFVNSMSDLFHESVPDAAIDRIFAVMALTPHHTYQVLTKRADRMREYLKTEGRRHLVADAAEPIAGNHRYWTGDGPTAWDLAVAETLHPKHWPLPNVWLGVSVEDQARADERIPVLLDTPAAVRWISAEPLLGPVDFYLTSAAMPRENHPWRHRPILGGIDWIVCGGESGRDAKPMHPGWARMLRDQCASAAVPFFFKQWGSWAPGEVTGPNERAIDAATWFDERWIFQRIGKAQPDDHIDDEPDVFCVGKKRAGRLLDGVEHNAFPHTKNDRT